MRAKKTTKNWLETIVLVGFYVLEGKMFLSFLFYSVKLLKADAEMKSMTEKRPLYKHAL